MRTNQANITRAGKNICTKTFEIRKTLAPVNKGPQEWPRHFLHGRGTRAKETRKIGFLFLASFLAARSNLCARKRERVCTRNQIPWRGSTFQHYLGGICQKSRGHLSRTVGVPATPRREPGSRRRSRWVVEGRGQSRGGPVGADISKLIHTQTHTKETKGEVRSCWAPQRELETKVFRSPLKY